MNLKTPSAVAFHSEIQGVRMSMTHPSWVDATGSDVWSLGGIKRERLNAFRGHSGSGQQMLNQADVLQWCTL